MCFKRNLSCAESLKILQMTFADSCMSKPKAYECYKAFKEDREVVVDLPRSGRIVPFTKNEDIHIIKKLVLENHRLRLRGLWQKVKKSFKSIHNIMCDSYFGHETPRSKRLEKGQFCPEKASKATSLCKSFCLKTQRMSSTKHRTLLIWSRVTLYYSRNYKYHFEVIKENFLEKLKEIQGR